MPLTFNTNNITINKINGNDVQSETFNGNVAYQPIPAKTFKLITEGMTMTYLSTTYTYDQTGSGDRSPKPRLYIQPTSPYTYHTNTIGSLWFPGNAYNYTATTVAALQDTTHAVGLYIFVIQTGALYLRLT